MKAASDCGTPNPTHNPHRQAATSFRPTAPRPVGSAHAPFTVAQIGVGADAPDVERAVLLEPRKQNGSRPTVVAQDALVKRRVAANNAHPRPERGIGRKPRSPQQCRERRSRATAALLQSTLRWRIERRRIDNPLHSAMPRGLDFRTRCECAQPDVCTSMRICVRAHMARVRIGRARSPSDGRALAPVAP